LSRSALVVAGALFALGALAWLLTGDESPPPAPAALQAGTAELLAPSPSGTAPPAPPPPVAAPPTPALPGPPPRISTRDEFRQALAARGLDGEKALVAYQDWRLARGYLDADPLTGVTPDNAPAGIYAAMDRASLRSLADSGDLGAMQAYAAGSLPGDPATALEYYGRASRLGSAAAMDGIAALLALGDGSTAESRTTAMAWTLAAIRLHGPIVATPDNLALVTGLESDPDPTLIATVCARSLAILADLRATGTGQDSGALPPAFVTERNLYDRLPCRDTPAPVMAPRALARCTPTPAVGGNNQPAELWICEEN